MALEHEQAATEILKAVGGRDNIVSAAHCATRLRLVIADDSKVDMDAVEDAKLAKGNFQANGQLQVIYGTGTVNKVYDEFVKQAGISAGSTEDVKAAAPKGNPLQRAIKALGDVFVPIIPAIVASGLLMGLTEGLNNAMGGALELNSWYLLIHTFANASFVFLQILIGFSAARVFGGNEYLGGVIGMIMNHTALLNAWNIPGAVTAFGDAAYQTVGTQAAADWLTSVTGTAVDAAGATVSAIIEAGGIPQIQLFGVYNVVLQGYQGHVIPVVIAVFLMCQIEKWLHNHVPDMFDLFVTPLCTVLVTGILTLTVIGPVFSAFEELVLQFFQFLIAIPYGLGGALTGAIYPFTVVLGVHHMFNALEASMCALVPPYDNFNPILSCCNVAQGAACLAVFVKTASEKKKGLALPSGISSMLGITEPAVYGVNLPAVKPFVGAICGAAVGGALVSILGVYSTAYGITGLFGFLITATPLQYAISILVAFAVAFGVTFALYSDDDAARRAEQKKATAKADAEVKAEPAELPQADDVPAAAAPTADSPAAAAAPASVAISQDAADALAAGEHVLVSPMAGQCIPMSEVGDPMFAAEVMGGGVGILPTDGKIYSPITGMVMMLFDTKHAIGLCTDDGSVEVLIHCGIDTVSLGGAPFTAHVKQGDHVEAGQLLMEADLAAIEAAGLKTDTPVIVTNTDAFAAVEGVNTGTAVVPGDLVVNIR